MKNFLLMVLKVSPFWEFWAHRPFGVNEEFSTRGRKSLALPWDFWAQTKNPLLQVLKVLPLWGFKHFALPGDKEFPFEDIKSIFLRVFWTLCTFDDVWRIPFWKIMKSCPSRGQQTLFLLKVSRNSFFKFILSKPSSRGILWRNSYAILSWFLSEVLVGRHGYTLSSWIVIQSLRWEASYRSMASPTLQVT